MKSSRYLFLLLSSSMSIAFADNIVANSSSSNFSNPDKQSESQIEREYSGVIGTGIKNNTVTATGGAIEFGPSSATFYGFFSQILSNGFYYEGRLYVRDNYIAQNPIFPTVPISNVNNPYGYGGAVKIGYDFHASELIDIVPYLRLNAYNNMSTVYQDTNGDYIHSTTYAVLPGVKIAYKVTPQFNPYIDLYGGWQQVNLTGGFPQSNTPSTATGIISQTTVTYEIGFSSKLTSNLALIPYMQYITTANSPDSSAAAPYSENGFNISSLTSAQQVFGLKLSASW